MKNTMKSVALFFALALTTSLNAQNNGNDNSLIGKAKGVAHECFTEGLHNFDINGSVETVGICYVSGEIKRVTLYGFPKCHQQPCMMKMMVRIIATIDFDCDGNIISVNCGGNAPM